MGPGTVNVVPHSHYPTKDDKWIAIACTNDKIFQRLLDVMGRPELGGSGRWGTIGKREADRTEVDDFVAAWTREYSAKDLLTICAEGQVPCGPVNSIKDIFEDPHFAARENMVRLPVEGMGEIVVANVVPRLSGTPGSVNTLGPRLGANTDEILTGLLNLDQKQVDDLRQRGVI
jgi:succinyl-CoA:(S)-malate CoA-transferase subunit B